VPPRVIPSLHARLVLAASLVLTLFLGGTGLVLDRAFRDAAEQALRERLQTQVYALLAAAELDERDRMQLPVELPEPRLNVAGSGLYAEVTSADGKYRWRSRSAVGLAPAFRATPAIGARVFEHLAFGTGQSLYALSLGVAWPDSRGEPRHFVFRAAESLEGFEQLISAWRRGLWGWLAAAAVLLLAVQGAILRWGLRPLRQVARDLAAIEAGRAERLDGAYPKELRGLTENLNALVAAQRAHLARYRDALGNLAHSLKTPLAVLRGALESRPAQDEARRTMQEQIERMREIVEYQLARASAAGRSPLGASVPVAPHVERITRALARVYADKKVAVTLDIAADAVFHGDEGDLVEVLGNLADNAFKWCRSKVAIRARRLETTPPRLELVIEDDGPGLAPEDAARLTERGARGDPRAPGQGIGLAVVRETVELYGGELGFARGALGGAAVTVRL
jgi:two-component system sensor histidine kinase PhoQ